MSDYWNLPENIIRAKLMELSRTTSTPREETHIMTLEDFRTIGGELSMLASAIRPILVWVASRHSKIALTVDITIENEPNAQVRVSRQLDGFTLKQLVSLGEFFGDLES